MGVASSVGIASGAHKSLDFCKLHSIYIAPLAISSKKMAAAYLPENDLYDEIFAADYMPHKLPTASAAISLVARAYGKLVQQADIDSRLRQPASLHEVCEFVNWKAHALIASGDHVRYYLNLHIPVVTCLRVPINWLTSSLEDILSVDSYTNERAVLIACVLFAHDGSSLFKIAFDSDEEVRIGIIEQAVLEMFARDLCVLDVTDPKKGPKIKLATPTSAAIVVNAGVAQSGGFEHRV